jgi:hypothetical protein
MFEFCLDAALFLQRIEQYHQLKRDNSKLQQPAWFNTQEKNKDLYQTINEQKERE